MINSFPMVSVIGVTGIPLIQKGDDLGKIICEASEQQGTKLQDNDVVVVTQKIVSKAEGCVVPLKEVSPSFFAKTVAEYTGKEPELVELILRQSRTIVRMSNKHLITETKHGWICANSGIDKSNVSGGDSVTLLPEDPDKSAQQIKTRIGEITGKRVAVIISDTFGRPLRRGHIDIAIGVAGIDPLWSRRGEKDLFGYTMRVKEAAVGDEIASAAELVIGNVREKIPVAIIRGYSFTHDDLVKVNKLIMNKEKNLFL